MGEEQLTEPSLEEMRIFEIEDRYIELGINLKDIQGNPESLQKEIVILDNETSIYEDHLAVTDRAIEAITKIIIERDYATDGSEMEDYVQFDRVLLGKLYEVEKDDFSIYRESPDIYHEGELSDLQGLKKALTEKLDTLSIRRLELKYAIEEHQRTVHQINQEREACLAELAKRGEDITLLQNYF